MIRLPPRSTRTDTLFPYTALFRSLVLQLDNRPDDTPGRVLARRIAIDHIDRLPRIGIEGVASELHCDLEQAEQALALLRSLDPRPGAQRSEERRVGKECVSTCRSRWSPYHYKQTKQHHPNTQVPIYQKSTRE